MAKEVVKPTRADVAEYRIWRHLPDGDFYYILDVGLCSTNGEREHKEESVLYFSLKYQGWRYREVSEFLDGRFEPVPGSKRGF